MKKIISFLIVGALSYSCASKDNRELEEREHENIAREYVVKDASSDRRPGWIEDAELWARNHSKDTKKFRYFSYETDPKVSRSVSCTMAKAKARADIAGEISTFINKELGVSTQGNANIDENNPHIESLREYVETNLTEKIQAMIHGAAIEKQYWEKRSYLKSRGAAKNFKAWTCSVFVRIPSAKLEKSIERASSLILKQTEDAEAKATVKEALERARLNFIKAKRGEI